MDRKELKRLLRAEAAAKRAAMDENVRLRLSEAACTLAENEVFEPLRRNKPEKGLTVFTYLSFKDELSTVPLVDSCLKQGDTVLVPRVTKGGRLSLHLFEGWNRLAAGIWGIPEPSIESPIWPESRYTDIDVVIVPGLVYDLQGGRIGYGGGYYDRFAEGLQSVQPADDRCKGPVLGSLLFEEQLVDRIPAQPHDLKLDVLVTAANVFYINQDKDV